MLNGPRKGLPWCFQRWDTTQGYCVDCHRGMVMQVLCSTFFVTVCDFSIASQCFWRVARQWLVYMCAFRGQRIWSKVHEAGNFFGCHHVARTHSTILSKYVSWVEAMWDVSNNVLFWPFLTFRVGCRCLHRMMTMTTAMNPRYPLILTKPLLFYNSMFISHFAHSCLVLLSYTVLIVYPPLLLCHSLPRAVRPTRACKSILIAML